MTDDPLGRDDPSLDASDFLDWLDEMADAEGKSREELIQTLVSSYWTLDEMLNLMEQADADADLPTSGPETSDGPASPGRRRLADVERDLAERIEDLDGRLDRLRSELDALPDEAADAERDALVESLADRVAEIEAEAEEGPAHADAAEVEAIADRVATLETTFTARHEQLEERIDTEFGHLHTILEHLIETTNDLEDRTTRSEAEAEIRDFLAAADRLATLKRTAAQLGAAKATCGYCDTNVRIALLPTPECPQCEREFVDIEPKQGWFGSATLVVSDQAYPRDLASRGRGTRAEEADGDAESGSDGTDDVGGFHWVGDD